MGFFSAQCPSCQKDIQVPDDTESSLCMYCGCTIFSAKTHSPPSLPKTENLLGMARTAYAGGNHAEAEAYFNRVLELDPALSEAWIGKGNSAGWQSTIVNMRFGEVITSFTHAIATALDSEKDKTISECVTQANIIVVTLYGMSRKHLLEYVALPNIWTDYVSQVSQMLSTLEVINMWMPKNKVTLENIVHLCKDNIEGITYRDQFDNNLSKGWQLSAEYERLMREKLDAAANQLREIDPSYLKPVAQPKKPDACFVVTATMGDANHPTVYLLRRFRDDWLLEKPGGARFIAWYYKHGPVAAKFIKNRKYLRAVSLIFIVTPAAKIAKFLLK